MVFTRFILPFSAGVATGVLLHKYWPQISESARPLLRSSLRSGARALEKGREKIHEKSEQLSDIIAEIREEEEAAAAAGGAPGKAQPRQPGTSSDEPKKA